jgi:hypothetical protein
MIQGQPEILKIGHELKEELITLRRQLFTYKQKLEKQLLLEGGTLSKQSVWTNNGSDLNTMMVNKLIKIIEEIICALSAFSI